MDRDERRRRLASNPYEALYKAEIISGCLTLPEECLKDLNSNSLIITTSWEQGLVYLYTPEHFEEVRRNLSLLNTMDSKARALKRRILGNAEEVNISDENTIHINSELLTELGFDANQEESAKEAFAVVILKYSYLIEIVSSSLYEELYS